MVKHIILWNLKEEYSEIEKKNIKANIKRHLEALCGNVPGLCDLKVITDGILPTSNAELMLDATLESKEALNAYAVHPLHVAAADTFVRPFTAQRSCLDFEV